MKFISLVTRLGLLSLGFILVAAVNADDVWSNPSTDQPTTSGLADALLSDWGFALLMSMAMMGAAYLVRDERMENLLWEFGGEEE